GRSNRVIKRPPPQSGDHWHQAGPPRRRADPSTQPPLPRSRRTGSASWASRSDHPTCRTPARRPGGGQCIGRSSSCAELPIPLPSGQSLSGGVRNHLPGSGSFGVPLPALLTQPVHQLRERLNRPLEALLVRVPLGEDVVLEPIHDLRVVPRVLLGQKLEGLHQVHLVGGTLVPELPDLPLQKPSDLHHAVQRVP